MSQSLSVVYLHLVFSTKWRQPFLSDRAIRYAMHARLGRTSAELGCPSICVGGVEDHVHILARYGRTISQADWVKELKRTSSLWMKQCDPRFKDFAWQLGYRIFSVGSANPEVVRWYIEHQEEHHAKQDFQNEFRGLLQEHDEPWNELYVWD